MNNRIALAVALLGIGVSAWATDPPSQPAASSTTSSAATPPQAQRQTAAKSRKSSNTSSPSATAAAPTDRRPAQVSRDTYHGAAGKKKDPGTACSTARLKKDGSLDCGMTGKDASPTRPK